MKGKLIYFSSLVLIIGGLLCFTVIVSPLYSGQEGKAEMAGDETCADCHDEIVAGFDSNPHKMHSEQGEFLCESCHGSGASHADSEEADQIYNPATDYNSVDDNACLKCHGGSDFESMDGSAHHELADGCSDCHVVHSDKKQLLKKQSNNLCKDCHTDVYALMNLPSHHPVKEGLMGCDDCHNVHGGDAKFTASSESNELCFSCHASKEGPFVYEHDPVMEDCQICHNPHGTVVDNLLVESEPALCLSCHPMHFHTQITGFDGAFASTPYYPERTGLSDAKAWKEGMLTKCTQCHEAVHGSDLPSQGIGSQSLTR